MPHSSKPCTFENVEASLRFSRRRTRLVKRLVSQELVLSFVSDAEQRLWRTSLHPIVQPKAIRQFKSGRITKNSLTVANYDRDFFEGLR
jgi:hypothetical protein